MGHRSLWHDQAREKWAGEQLFFWRFRFPSYDRERIVGTLTSVMAEVDCTSYAIYELFSGGDDILLRMWVRSNHGPLKRFFNAAFPDSRIRIGHFIVSKVITHWPFCLPESTTMRMPTNDVVQQRLKADEIAKLESGHMSHEQYGVHEEAGLVAPAPHTRGIKFAVEISGQRSGMSNWAEEKLEADLQQIIHSAPSILEKSLYAGTGSASYLFLGRVAPEDFSKIAVELTVPVNRMLDPGQFDARTTTSIMATEDFLAFQERLVLPGAIPDPEPAEVLLTKGESQLIEVKGSAFVDLKTWLQDGGPLAARDWVTESGVLKAIVGMLNATGGTIVVGAVEQKKFPDVPAVMDLPQVGAFRCCGLEPDLGSKGNFDDFELKLRNLVASRISREANQYVDFLEDGIEHKKMCRLIVSPPSRGGHRPLGDRWFWLRRKDSDRSEFYVRQGNRTVRLEGREIDEYRDQYEDR